MDSDSKLSMSAQFKLETFKRQISEASREQAINLAVETFQLFLLQQEVTRNLMKDYANGKRTGFDD